MKILLKNVKSPSELRKFIDLPWQLYKNNPNWVPPLKITVKDYLDTKKNPFYQHSQIKMWLAYQDNHCVGRIAGIIDEHYNKFQNEKVIFWGFFEVTDNSEVSTLLFDTVKKWGKSHGMNILRGPMNPSTNHECGLQISAFDTEPYFMMTANPSYYMKHCEQYGFKKAKDLYAWLCYTKTYTLDERRTRIANKKIEKQRYSFRSLNLKQFKQETEKLFQIYNDAWEKNWGFVPMSAAEFKHMSKELKAIIDPELCIMVEVDGEPVGFSLTVPNLNEVTKKIRNGKLLPFGIFKLLWHTKIKPSINTYRIITLGVKKQHQSAGLGAILLHKTEEILRNKGAQYAEASWILEDNHMMNNSIETAGAKHYKTYRIYDLEL